MQAAPAAAPGSSVQLHSSKQDAAQQRAKGWAEGLKEAMAAAGSETGAARSTIIYASRTHSQLAQVMGELKNTSYRSAWRLFNQLKAQSHRFRCCFPREDDAALTAVKIGIAVRNEPLQEACRLWCLFGIFKQGCCP